MKTPLLLLTFCVLLVSVSAQTFIKMKTVVPPTPGNNDGVVTFSAMNLPPTCELQFMDNFGANPYAVSAGDTVTGVSSYSVLSNFVAPILYAGFDASGIEFQVTAYTPPTNAFTTDGSIELTFNVPLPDSLMAFTDYVSIPAYQFPHTTSDELVYTISNLSEGNLMIEYNGSGLYPELGYFQSIGYIGDLVPVSTLEMELTYQDDTDGTCNGSAVISVADAVEPLIVAWSALSLGDTLSVSGLCPGYYQVVCTDANGSVGYLDFIITDSAGTYLDTSYQLPNGFVDTLHFLYSNCSMNYDLPIDSILFEEEPVQYIGGALLLQFQLTVYQADSVYTIIDSVAILNDVNYLMDFGFYCESFKKSTNAFDGKRVLLERFASPVAGIHTLQQFPVMAYPNPVKEELRLTETVETLVLFNTLGQVVKTAEHTDHLLLTDLKPGTYFVQLNDQAIFPVVHQ